MHMEEVFFHIIFVCTQIFYHMAKTMLIVTTALHTMHSPALLLIQGSREGNAWIESLET